VGQATERARPLVAMEPAELAEPEGQIAIRAQVRAIDERALEAVHRLETERLPFRLDQEHVVAIEIPMPGLLPQPLAHDDRRAYLLVATADLELAHRALERPPDLLALGVPEGRAGADVVEAEQVELDAQPTVVALLGLGPAPQELVELLLGR